MGDVREEGWAQEKGESRGQLGPPGNAPGVPAACVLPAGLQGAPPARFAEGEAETPRD